MVNAAPPSSVFDLEARKCARIRCVNTLPAHDFLFKWTQNVLLERLSDIKRQFPRSALLGGRTSPDFSDALKIQAGSDFLTKMDILPGAGVNVVGEEEFLPFRQGALDAVFSVLDLHAVNDLPGALLQIRRSLRPDGLFLAALFGGETLHELRASLMQAELSLKGGIAPRIFPFADKPQMGALLQRAGFSLPVVDSEILSVSYDNIFKLMHDLRFMGESNVIAARSKTNPGRALFLKAAEHYGKNFKGLDGRLNASFEIIFLIGWAPHESQQQPLAPGSAQKRLSDALQTAEVKIDND
ncbi:MAG: methyltransferase domain-containing protein [Alphaproteobacteria bacterium]|nr:methyltransferase domain-containing protein [Alphaproteobacteria bacterium]